MVAVATPALAGWPDQQFALLFVDWLKANRAVRADYLEVKRAAEQSAALQGADVGHYATYLGGPNAISYSRWYSAALRCHDQSARMALRITLRHASG